MDFNLSDGFSHHGTGKKGGHSLLAAPCLTRTSTKALIGATPVPGPTRMMGTSGSGRNRVGEAMCIGMRVPVFKELSNLYWIKIFEKGTKGRTDRKSIEP